MTLAELLSQAKSAHRNGGLREAESGYRQILHVQPENAEVHYLLGVLLAQQERLDEAVASLQNAWRLSSQNREVDLMLHRALAAREINRAAALVDQANLDDAAACCRRAIEHAPHEAAGYENLGNILKGQGRLREATDCYRSAIRLGNDSAEVRCKLGIILMHEKLLEDAEEELRRAIELKPTLAEGHNNLGAVLARQMRFDEAVNCFRRLLELKPDNAEGHSNLGAALAELGHMDEAVDHLGRAIQLNPNYIEAHCNLGDALRNQRRLDEAEACYVQALTVKSDFAPAHVHLAFTKLARGEFPEGWKEFEWRSKLPDIPQVAFNAARWDGSDLAGRTILVHCDQGFGDTLQFIRFAKSLKARGAGKVIVACEANMAGLVATCAGVDQLAVAGTPPPKCDLYVPLLSLPFFLGSSDEGVAAEVPYVFPSETDVHVWRNEFLPVTELKIGIAWQGNPAQSKDRLRSMHLANFAPIARLGGIRLYSLQKGAGREQLAQVPANWPLVDLGDRLGDFLHTAAIIQNLDLVITCDSAPAHLAGALGVPTWIALAFACDWRWMLERLDSPWYPSVRLFRQSRSGDWPDVFGRIAAAVGDLLRDRERN